MRKNNHNISERLGSRLINRSESARGFHRFPTSATMTSAYPPQFGEVQTVRISVNGFRPDEISIQLVQHLLIIKGEHRTGFTSEERTYILNQRERRECERVLELSEVVDLNRITAHLVEETLIIRLYPKTEDSEPAPLTQKIEIN